MERAEQRREDSEWSWYDAGLILANDDVLKLDKVSKLNLYTALTNLTRKYMRYKEAEREQRNKK